MPTTFACLSSRTLLHTQFGAIDMVIVIRQTRLKTESREL